MIRINLIKPQQTERSIVRLVAYSLVGLALVCLLFFGTSALVMKNATKNYTAQLQELAVQQAEIKAQTVATEKQVAFQQLDESIQAIEGYTYKKVPIIDMLTARLPENGYISSLVFSIGGELTIQMDVDEPMEANNYFQELQQVEELQEVFMQHIEQVKTTVEEKEFIRYRVHYSMRYFAPQSDEIESETETAQEQEAPDNELNE